MEHGTTDKARNGQKWKAKRIKGIVILGVALVALQWSTYLVLVRF